MSLADDMFRLVHKATSRMRTQVGMMIARAVVESVGDGSGFQGLTVTVLAGESLDDVEHLQPGGLSHVSVKGAEGVLLCTNGSRDNAVALGVANRGERPKDLLPGATVVYAIGPLAGQLRISPLGAIEATGSSGTADDFVAMAGKVLSRLEALETAHNSHIHITTATIGLSPVGVIAPPVIIVSPPITAVASSNLKADD